MLELTPDDEEAEEAVERLEATAAQWRAVADRFAQEAADATDATLAASLYARAAAVVWQYKKKGAAKEADKLFKKAVAASSTSFTASQASLATRFTVLNLFSAMA